MNANPSQRLRPRRGNPCNLLKENLHLLDPLRRQEFVRLLDEDDRWIWLLPRLDRGLIILFLLDLYPAKQLGDYQVVDLRRVSVNSNPRWSLVRA